MNLSPFTFEMLIKQRGENLISGLKILVLENYKIDNPRLCKEILKRHGVRWDGEIHLDVIFLLRSLGFERVDFLSNLDELEMLNLGNDIPEDKKYDVILDNGTLHKIINFPLAIKNIGLYIVKGGSIVHILPLNNYVDFGYYQISPKLLNNVYKKNEFINKKLYIIKHHQEVDVVPWQFIEYSPEFGKKIQYGGLDDSMYLTWLTATKS
jgi:hypothetical protein